MRRSRCVGLMGGVGVGAATHYYTELARASEARGFALELAMVHADLGRVLGYVQAGDRAGLAAYQAGLLRRMEAAGAECAVIPSVTSHFAIRELRGIAGLPVNDIFEPLRAEILRRRIGRVAVFGTRFVIDSEMFGWVPEVEFVRPRPAEVEAIHETYMRLAADGFGTEAQYASLRELALRVCERERVEAIVLGGTDLSLIFHEGNTDFPHLDCAALHLRAIEAAVFP